MRFFSKFRKNQFSGSKFKKYILYAIGEIFLLVVGILIAVSINNWNENSKTEKQLTSLLKIYKQDLVVDTTKVYSSIKQLEEREEAIQQFLGDKVTSQDYMENPLGFSLTLTYSPFKLQSKGYRLLENYTSSNELKTDSLTSRIITSHKAYSNLLEDTFHLLGEDIRENLNYLKNNEVWVADFLSGNLNNPKMMDYYLSETYRSRLAVHQVLASGNLLVQLKSFQEHSRKTLEILEDY